MKILTKLINQNFLREKIENAFFSKKETAKAGLPLITFSREMGAGGKPMAKLAVKKLGRQWQVYHEEIVDKIAEEAKLEKKLVSEIDENQASAVDEFLADFFGRRYLSLSAYHQHLTKILTTIAKKGSAIIIGRGAEYLFPEALKIRVICEMEQRINWEMEFEKISRKEAVKRISESDKTRDKFIEELYGHNERKPHHYDLVIKTGPDLSIETAANLIVHLAKKRFKI